MVPLSCRSGRAAGEERERVREKEHVTVQRASPKEQTAAGSWILVSLAGYVSDTVTMCHTERPQFLAGLKGTKQGYHRGMKQPGTGTDCSCRQPERSGRKSRRTEEAKVGSPR